MNKLPDNILKEMTKPQLLLLISELYKVIETTPELNGQPKGKIVTSAKVKKWVEQKKRLENGGNS